MSQGLTVVLLFALAYQAVAVSGECRNTSHCILTHPRCTVVGIEDLSCLESTLNQLRSSGKTLVNFQYTKLPKGLPGGVFKDVTFNSLVFQFFNLGSLNSSDLSPFAGATYVTKLAFQSPVGHIRNWNFEPLSALKVNHLVFSGFPEFFFNLNNQLPEKFKYAGTGYVQTLEITAACLRTLLSRSLSTFVNMERLRLVGNRITTIGRDVFPAHANRLKEVDLRNNNIMAVADPQFWNPNLPSLREIRLEGNALTTIELRYLTSNLQKFYINGNKLHCCPELAWIAAANKSVWNKGDGSPATCQKPRELRGRELWTLSKEDLLNADC